MAKRVYWIALKKAIVVLCHYINKWEGELPNDLPQAVYDCFPYVRLACAAIEAYDDTHPRGNISN